MAHHNHDEENEEVLEEFLEADGSASRRDLTGLSEADEVGAPGVGVNVSDAEPWPEA